MWEAFQKIADREGGKFYHDENTYLTGGGTALPDLNFVVKFEYKNIQFVIHNQTGANFVGNVYCKLPKQSKSHYFHVTPRSNFMSLFSKDRDKRFSIKSKNANLAYFIKNNASFKSLEEVARQDRFEPYISAKNEAGKFKIQTKYNLDIDDWTQVLDPIIQFYKDLINEFKKDRLNLAEQAYSDQFS